MNTGACLCGNISWSFSGESVATYNCHCAMCRKAHGAAFGTYAMIPSGEFSWTSGEGSWASYSSSPSLDRTFCPRCGSMIPNEDPDDGFVYVTLGNHDQGPEPESHIFAGSKAPWHTIHDELPQFADFPPDVGLEPLPNRDRPDPVEGKVRGSCLCGGIEFQVTEPFKVVYNCHCHRCRRARSAAFTTNGFVSDQGVEFTRGEELLASFKLPDAQFFTQYFCSRCGSGMPRVDHDRGIAVIPLGALDDDPQHPPDSNIFVDDSAQWYAVDSSIPCFKQAPD